MEQIAQRVFVLVAVEPALGGAAFLGDTGGLGVRKGLREGFAESRQLVRLRALFLLRRHLALGHAIKAFDPFGEVLPVLRIELQGREVEPTLLLDVVVAARAMLVDKRLGALGRARDRGTACRHRKQQGGRTGEGLGGAGEQKRGHVGCRGVPWNGDKTVIFHRDYTRSSIDALVKIMTRETGGSQTFTSARRCAPKRLASRARVR